MAATVTVFSPPSPCSISPFSSPGTPHIGRFLVYDVRISTEEKGIGSTALLRPTAEKSAILFYSCGILLLFKVILLLCYKIFLKATGQQSRAEIIALGLLVCSTALFHWSRRTLLSFADSSFNMLSS